MSLIKVQSTVMCINQKSIEAHGQNKTADDQRVYFYVCVFVYFLFFNMRVMGLLNGNNGLSFLRIVKKNNRQEKRNNLSSPSEGAEVSGSPKRQVL